jgi:hypothetical protein
MLKNDTSYKVNCAFALRGDRNDPKFSLQPCLLQRKDEPNNFLIYSFHCSVQTEQFFARSNNNKACCQSHFVIHYPFPAERSTLSFDGMLASESGCGALRSGEDVEFATSERFYPWCVDLGSVMLSLGHAFHQGRGKSKHSLHHRQITQRPHGEHAERDRYPNRRP